ncbi:MAG: hypothetical protein U0232_03670 [Thermomicrobiales bacterium]
MASFALAPELAERVRGGRREEQFVGTGDLPFFYRKPYGPGWALVGDAGYHKDPNLGQGISDAFRDAELLAGALDAGLSGRQPLAAALAMRAAAERGDGGDLRLRLPVGRAGAAQPRLLRILGALPGNQPDTDSFLGLIAGTTRPSAFFAPANVRPVLGGNGVPAECTAPAVRSSRRRLEGGPGAALRSQNRHSSCFAIVEFGATRTTIL